MPGKKEPIFWFIVSCFPALWSHFYKGTNPIHEVSPHVSLSPPKTPSPNTIIQELDFGIWILWRIQMLSSVQFSCSVVSESLRPHGLQHARPPCPSPTPRVHPNPCPLSRWCHPTISSSVIPFSSCPQSFPASGSFPMSQLFASGGQSIGVLASASVLQSVAFILFEYSRVSQIVEWNL